MEEFSSLDNLADWLDGKPRRIGIDGVDGARKSSTATFLSQRTAIKTIHVDEFLDRNQGGYVDFIRYDDLAHVLSRRAEFIVDVTCSPVASPVRA